MAKHYGAVVEPCPPRRGNRKGAVESSVRFTSGRWWRTMSATEPRGGPALPRRLLRHAPVTSVNAGGRAGAHHGRCTGRRRAAPRPPGGAVPGHHRGRTDRGRQRHRRLSWQPLLGAAGTRRARRCSSGTGLSSPTIDVVAPSGAILVTHRLAPAGSGALVRSPRAQRGARGRRAQRLHHGSVRVTRRPTVHRAKRRSTKRRASSDPSGASPSSTSSVYDEVAEGPMSESSIYQQIRGHLAYLRLSCRRRSAARRARPCPQGQARALRLLGSACSRSR